MVLVNDGKNRIRDLLNSDIYKGEHGTDSTAPTSGDTDLVAGVAATDATPTNTSGNKIVNSTHILLSTVSTGTTFKEFGVYVNSGATLLSRVVFPNYAHTANTELQVTTVYRIN